jgi:N-carbamoylputrescine amidase
MRLSRLHGRFVGVIVASLVVVYSVPVGAHAAKVKIAVVQLSSAQVGDFSAMRSYAQTAKEAGAQIVVFPETSDMGWLNPDAFFNAAPIPGVTTDAFASIAKSARIWVVTGLAERGPPIAAQPPTYQAYDSAVLIDPNGVIVLRHRKFNVLKNAFSSCPAVYGSQGCSYTPGPLSETIVARTSFGVVGLLVCADAYTYDPSSLDALKLFSPSLVIIPWGITAASLSQCGQDGFDATSYAAKAAAYLRTAYVVGANATGARPYGRFLPSWYCGTSGFATPNGGIGGELNTQVDIGYFEIPLPK